MRLSLLYDWSELTKRVVFGSLLGAITLFLTLYNALSFHALLLMAALLMYAEWKELTRDFPLLNRLGGLVYVGVPIWSMMTLRGAASAEHVLVLFALVWATDIAAYFGGKRFGKTKLAPAISPGKSWEGLGFGVLACGMVGSIASLIASFPLSPWGGALIGATIAIISQMGDLFESWLKRRAGVKDSGTLIPGHGGILDRVDGLVFAAPVYALMVMQA